MISCYTSLLRIIPTHIFHLLPVPFVSHPFWQKFNSAEFCNSHWLIKSCSDICNSWCLIWINRIVFVVKSSETWDLPCITRSYCANHWWNVRGIDGEFCNSLTQSHISSERNLRTYCNYKIISSLVPCNCKLSVGNMSRIFTSCLKLPLALFYINSFFNCHVLLTGFRT